MGLCISKQSGAYVDRHDSITRAQPENAAASPSTSSEASTHASPFSQLPRRARRKAESLANTLRHANNVNPQLAHYAQRVLDTVTTSQTTREISNLDARNLGILAETYNDKYPGLNLQCARTPTEFRAALAATYAPSWRSIAILDPRGSHRIAIDVRTHDDGRRSLLVMETTQALKHDQHGQPMLQNGYPEFIDALNNEFGASAMMAVIDVKAQKSKIGCQPFCFNFALQAFHHARFFDDLHKRLHNHGSCFKTGAQSQHVKGVEYIDGTKILPAVFYKHAESRGTVDTVLNQQRRLAKENVSTSSNGPSETLKERVNAFRIKRDALAYSMSIEASRMRKIQEAISHDSRRNMQLGLDEDSDS
ncbi:YopJ family type III secretion system effector XopJ (plasmid) [Ralstonia sp. 25C]|uniref:YopJ family type III secretion system effector XopJ n=1 Tax=Ralstonia sp. 25C TaxID=3447363 RepID=UPI003F7518AF